MANREKVIKHIVDYINAVDGLTNVQWVLAELDILKDALTPLKAHEAMEPQFVQDVNGAYAACGKCNHKLWKLSGAEFTVVPSEMPRFCSSCGQKVKWE